MARRPCCCTAAEPTLQAAFEPFGHIQNIKLIKEKGVSGRRGALGRWSGVIGSSAGPVRTVARSCRAPARSRGPGALLMRQ
jgi:hypothetical protein